MRFWIRSLTEGSAKSGNQFEQRTSSTYLPSLFRTCVRSLRRLFRLEPVKRPPGRPSRSTPTTSEGFVFARSDPAAPLRQGEIVSNLRRAKLTIESVGNEVAPVVNFEPHPYAIILTQDCDLDLDRKARLGEAKPDKRIPDVLFCEAVTAEELRGGSAMNSTIWSHVKIHGHERYQILEAVGAQFDLQATGVPSLGLDFKRHFTMPVDEVYLRIEIGEARRRCRLVSPFLEHLSSRFARFQSRVALPEG